MTKLLPPDGQVYSGMSIRLGRTDADGATWGDSRPFAERVRDTIATELAGRKPAFLRVYAPWQSPAAPGRPMYPFSTWAADIAEAQSVTGPNSAVFLDWSLTNATSATGGLTVKDIALGRRDPYITAFAEAVRRYRRPLLIRLFGGEVNGSWWWAVSPLANPSLTTRDFVAAWRRVVGIFRREGALNASWAWNVNAVPPWPVPWADSNLAAYWPGDAYVDWAGADVYDQAPVSDLDSAYAFARAHHKPFFLAEWGVRIGGSTLTPPQQNEWLNAMFDYVESHPAIKAISYFNENSRPWMGPPIDPAKLVCLYDGKVCYQANSNDFDHRLVADSGAGFRATYSRRISSPRYLSETLTTTVVPKPPRPAVIALTVGVRGARAVVHWRGNSVARSYDVALRRLPGAWRTVASRYRRTSYPIRGKKGQRYKVEVRARNAALGHGSWSAVRTFTLR